MTDRRQFVALAFCIAIFVLIRAPWFDHLLNWDEAMNLLSVRAFAAGGHDDYSPWFWRYPPIFNLLLVLVQPLASGFIIRAEWVTCLVQVGGLVALYALVRRSHGNVMAIAACAALALMPGSIFLGVWIKQDHLATSLGLLAVWLCLRQRWAFAGLALGIAMLSKQFAAFFAIAIAIELARAKKWKPLAIVGFLSIIASAWWYLLFSSSDQIFLQFATTGTAAKSDLWVRPWHYYASVLWRDIGPAGLALAAAGAYIAIRKRDSSQWPLALLVPTLFITSCVPGKTPWYLLCTYPAIATLQAIAAIGIWKWIRPRIPASVASPRLVGAALALATATLLVLPATHGGYERQLAAREYGMWDASFTSREAALALNARVRPGETALITTMHYYGPTIHSPCPIFVIHLADMPVVVRDYTLTAPEMIADIRKFDITWAMVSPEPGPPADRLASQLYREFQLTPRRLRDALIYPTAAIRNSTPKP